MVFVTIHPRQQTTIAQTGPLIIGTILIAKGMNNICQIGRRTIDKERNVSIYLVNKPQNCYACVQFTVLCEIAAQAIDIGLWMRLQIEVQFIIRISQSYFVFFLIAQYRDSCTMHIVTKIASQVLIRIGRLHNVNSGHQSCMLIDRIAVNNNILDSRTEFHITALFQPTSDTTIIKIINGQSLVIKQQGNQFVNIICYEVLLWIYDETTILQNGWRHINLHILAQEPALYFIISPTCLRINRRQSLNNHLYTIRQFVDSRQTTFILLTHHHTLILTQRIFTQPERHQRDTQRIEVGSRGNLHLTVNDVIVHFWGSIHWRTCLCRTVHFLVTFQHTGDSEISQHDFLVICLTEEIVARLDILVNDVIIMAICQCCSSLQGYATELVEIAIQIVWIQRTSTKIFHQFVIAILTVNIRLAIVVYPDYHLHTDILDDAHQRFLDGKVWIVHFQDALSFFTFNQEYLSLAGIIAQTLDTSIHSAFQKELYFATRLTLHILTRTDGHLSIATGSRLTCTDAYCHRISTICYRLGTSKGLIVHILFVVFYFSVRILT